MLYFPSIDRKSQKVADDVRCIFSRTSCPPRYIIENLQFIKILWDYVEKYHADNIDGGKIKLGSLLNSHMLHTIAPAVSLNSFVYQYAMRWTLQFFRGITIFKDSQKFGEWARYIENLFYDELIEMITHLGQNRHTSAYTDPFYDQIEKLYQANVFNVAIEWDSDHYVPLEFRIEYKLETYDEIIQETYTRSLDVQKQEYNPIVNCKRIYKLREYTKRSSFNDHQAVWVPTFKVLSSVQDNPIVFPF